MSFSNPGRLTEESHVELDPYVRNLLKASLSSTLFAALPQTVALFSSPLKGTVGKRIRPAPVPQVKTSVPEDIIVVFDETGLLASTNNVSHSMQRIDGNVVSAVVREVRGSHDCSK